MDVINTVLTICAISHVVGGLFKHLNSVNKCCPATLHLLNTPVCMTVELIFSSINKKLGKIIF